MAGRILEKRRGSSTHMWTTALIRPGEPDCTYKDPVTGEITAKPQEALEARAEEWRKRWKKPGGLMEHTPWRTTLKEARQKQEKMSWNPLKWMQLRKS